MSNIKELAKELCEKSGCHHLCRDTDKCIVEDDAKELFKQALVEGVNRHFDKTIEEEKQIEEMRAILCRSGAINHCEYCEDCEGIVEALYNAGYRKQSEGEWVKPYKGACADPFYTCSACGAGALLTQRVDNSKVVRVLTPYCPHCGAKMKGGEKQ